jgi:hypothetical protein
MGLRGLGSSGSEQEQVAGSWEYGDEPSASIQRVISWLAEELLASLGFFDTDSASYDHTQ